VLRHGAMDFPPGPYISPGAFTLPGEVEDVNTSSVGNCGLEITQTYSFFNDARIETPLRMISLVNDLSLSSSIVCVCSDEAVA